MSPPCCKVSLYLLTLPMGLGEEYRARCAAYSRCTINKERRQDRGQWS